MGKPIHILIVEDSENAALLLVRALQRGGYDPTYRRVDTPAAMKEALEHEAWDLITADHSMPHFSSTAALQMVREMELDVPFIIVSGTIGEEAAVVAMKAGAHDYLLKDNLNRLVPAVDRELRDAIQRRTQRQAEQDLLAHQEQLRIAREIQQGLFPAAELHLEHFDIAGRSIPTEATGGDYFDYIPMQHDQLGIVIGDITGHGLGASLLMAEMRACFRTLALSCGDVSEILARANQLTREDFGNDRFLTVLFALLNPQTGSLMYLNAGHPSGYVFSQNGSVRTELKSACMPLGMNPSTEFPPATLCPLEPGDLVLFLTDGVLDAFASEQDIMGTARAIDLVRTHRHEPASKIVDILCRAARDSVPAGSQLDDITALALKVEPDVVAKQAVA
jgi:serine phosphatase RsbU (regulator of sigma subunit)